MTKTLPKVSGAPTWIAFAVALLTPGSLSAQPVGSGADSAPGLGPVRWDLGLSLIGAQPVGEFADYVNLGSGFSLFGVFRLRDDGSLRLRLDLELISYGSTTVETLLSPTVPFVDVAVTTENAIGSLALGPELMLGDGSFRPYLQTSVGSSQFVTTTSVWSSGSTFPFASTENFEDYTYVLTGGGGLRIVVSGERPHPFALDLGGRYVRHGLTTYLREGGVRQGPGGEVLIEPIRSKTNLMTFHLGVTVGFR